MAIVTLILGESGAGKSTSLKNLDPKETFIINVLDKPLPFRGYQKNYKSLSPDGNEGNYYFSDDANKVLKVLNLLNIKRPEIKNLIIDDWQYIMANEFMRRSSERGFDKFTDIGRNAWSIIKALNDSRSDLNCFVLAHSELDNSRKYKAKTIGKMLDDKITIEGMFTVVLHALVNDGNYQFLTNNDGCHISKSPQGMFDSQMIPNDLLLVKKCMEIYFNSDLEM